MGEAAQSAIFSLLSGILHLGNVEFEPDARPQKDDGARVKESGAAAGAVAAAARLLELNDNPSLRTNGLEDALIKVRPLATY